MINESEFEVLLFRNTFIVLYSNQVSAFSCHVEHDAAARLYFIGFFWWLNFDTVFTQRVIQDFLNVPKLFKRVFTKLRDDLL